MPASSPSPSGSFATERRTASVVAASSVSANVISEVFRKVRTPSADSAQAGSLAGDAPAGFQNIAGDGQFVGEGADVAGGVVQHQVFEVDEFAVDRQRSAGIAKMGSFDPPSPTGERAMRSSRHASTMAASKCPRERKMHSLVGS